MKKIYFYKRFERFWHWTQVTFILFLALTGLEIHGYYHLFGFKEAVMLHNNTAILYTILFALILLWIFFSDEWRQYVPTTKHLIAQIKYYTKGIFKGEPHPTHKTNANKFNDLQRLTYIGLIFFILPIMIISGLIYMNHNYLQEEWGIAINLSLIGYTHVFLAFFLISFVIGHVYLTTTGYKPLSAIKAMLTGWEEMSDEEAQESLREYLGYTLHKIESTVDNPQAFSSVFNEIKNQLQTNETGLKNKLNRAKISYIKLNKNNETINSNEEAQTQFGDNIFSSLDSANTQILKENIQKSWEGNTITNIKIKVNNIDYFISFTPVYENNQIVAVELFVIEQ